jgi:hypothetical protein
MRIAWSIVFLAFLTPIAAFPQAPQPFDVVIEGGRIVDGTGNPWYLADIGGRSSHWLESWKGTSTDTLTADFVPASRDTRKEFCLKLALTGACPLSFAPDNFFGGWLGEGTTKCMCRCIYRCRALLRLDGRDARPHTAVALLAKGRRGKPCLYGNLVVSAIA